MDMAGVWRAFADAAGPAAISALWQGTAMALGLGLSLRLAPRIAAADRFRAWAAGFAALVALPFLPQIFSFVQSFFTANALAAAGSMPVVAAPHVWLRRGMIDLDPRWSLAIAGVWLAASLARVVDLGVHTLHLRRLWKRAVPIDSEIPLDRTVEICSTRDLDRPSVIGFFAPRILIPDWLLERLSAAELEQVVLHEAEHLRRGDDWINLLQKLCLVVFPLNPALAWMERRLCREREMACDEGVVRRTQAPRAYAACLASLAERGLEHRAEALSLGAWQRRPELADRVHRILRRAPGLHPAAARVLLGVVGCGLVFGSVELARCPQLVEFAARPAVSGFAEINAGAAVDGRPMGGFHRVDAVARVHTRAELAEARTVQRQNSAMAHGAQWSSALATDFQTARSASRAVRAVSAAGDTEDGARNGHAKSSLARNILAKSDDVRQGASGAEVAVKDAAPSSAAAQQEWIVYTEWEQVSSTAPAASLNSDQTASAPQALRRFTVTQLIFRVVAARAMSNALVSDGPAANATSSATSATTVPAVKSGAAQRKISIAPLPVPIRDGWLVIQL